MALLQGKTAVITGAGRGLGRALAAGFASAGARVWICARTRSELNQTSNLILSSGGDLQVRDVDLARPDACLAFIEEVLDQDQVVDILVNNAGVLRLLSLEELELDVWRQHLAVNLTAPYLLLTRAVLPGMRKQGGSVINVSSRAGIWGFPNESAYCATKFALEGFTKALACELEQDPVSINTVTPGLRIKPTSLTEEGLARHSKQERKKWNDPAQLMPAFLLLSNLRGEVSGLRFDALKLTEAIEQKGPDLSEECLLELAE